MSTFTNMNNFFLGPFMHNILTNANKLKINSMAMSVFQAKDRVSMIVLDQDANFHWAVNNIGQNRYTGILTTMKLRSAVPE